MVVSIQLNIVKCPTSIQIANQCQETQKKEEKNEKKTIATKVRPWQQWPRSCATGYVGRNSRNSRLATNVMLSHIFDHSYASVTFTRFKPRFYDRRELQETANIPRRPRKEPSQTSAWKTVVSHALQTRPQHLVIAYSVLVIVRVSDRATP